MSGSGWPGSRRRSVLITEGREYVDMFGVMFSVSEGLPLLISVLRAGDGRGRNHVEQRLVDVVLCDQNLMDRRVWFRRAPSRGRYKAANLLVAGLIREGFATRRPFSIRWDELEAWYASLVLSRTDVP